MVQDVGRIGTPGINMALGNRNGDRAESDGMGSGDDHKIVKPAS